VSGIGVSEIDFCFGDCLASGTSHHTAYRALCGGLAPQR
jgi:hypothetical protein